MSLLVLFSAPEKRTDWGLGVNPQQGKNPAKKNSEECSLFQQVKLLSKLDLLCARKSSSKLGSSLAISAGLASFKA